MSKQVSLLRVHAADLAHPWVMADCPRDMLECFAADLRAERHRQHRRLHLCRSLTADLKAIRRGLRDAA